MEDSSCGRSTDMVLKAFGILLADAIHILTAFFA